MMMQNFYEKKGLNIRRYILLRMDNEFKKFMDFMNVKLIPEQEHAIYDVSKNIIIVDKNDEIKTQTKRRKK